MKDVVLRQKLREENSEVDTLTIDTGSFNKR